MALKCLVPNGSPEVDLIMGIACVDAVHHGVKVVFNLLGGLDDDPAARDYKVHLLLELIPRPFQDCSGEAQGGAVALFSDDGFHGFRPRSQSV